VKRHERLARKRLVRCLDDMVRRLRRDSAAATPAGRARRALVRECLASDNWDIDAPPEHAAWARRRMAKTAERLA
jgi:hypothetical protein